MKPVKCPNCGNDRFEMHLYCNLNLHAEALAIAPKENKGSIEYLSLGEKAPQTAYSCNKCEYTIESLADLNILEIPVYIVGNSISKQRQGLNRISSITPSPNMPPDVLIAFDGIVGSDPDISKGTLNHKRIMAILLDIGHIQLGNSWIFTKNAWQKAQQDPSFRLSESQYTVKIKDLT